MTKEFIVMDSFNRLSQWEHLIYSPGMKTWNANVGIIRYGILPEVLSIDKQVESFMEKK